jgi:GTP-binding protein YchF
VAAGRLCPNRQRGLNDRSFVVLGPARNRGEPLAFSPKPAHEGPTFPSSTTASMGFKCGIVGLPNVGKSTLFNALTQTAAAQAANYPFCTIEPNVGDVAVPDPRLAILADIAGSKEIIPTRLTFVDIAGLVRGASKGEGLGNQFLANIRECDAIAHVVRCFEDGDVTHVEGRIDPLSDIATIETELMLADLESLERRIAQIEKRAKGGDKDARDLLALAERSLAELKEGRPARAAGVGRDERRLFQSLGLLSSKPVLYVCNVDEASADKGNAFSDQVKQLAANEGAAAVVVSAKIESEIAVLPQAEQNAYLEAVGLSEPGLDRVIRAGYDLLHLVTFFTAGPKEARAWTVERGAKAPQAAGVIHTDFEKGFIRAETIAYDDYAANRGEAGAREAGKFRLEGKDYVVADGDVMHFRFAN